MKHDSTRKTAKGNRIRGLSVFHRWLLAELPRSGIGERESINSRMDFGQPPGAVEDGVEHGDGQSAGEGVLLAGVVAAYERVGADGCLGGVGEARSRPYAQAVSGQGTQGAVPSE